MMTALDLFGELKILSTSVIVESPPFTVFCHQPFAFSLQPFLNE
jgi:hypothetical protein